MSGNKNRYKAIIDNKAYTIIGSQSKNHMDLVTGLVNEQLNEIRHMSPQITSEQSAILLAINAVSEQLNKQTQILKLEKENNKLKQDAIRLAELENRVKRMEAIENEAKEVLKQNGQEDIEITDHVVAQQVLNENRKKQIQEKTSQN
ncbi:cell division protein ZapA [Enterococcus sp. PF1-24]|uniref:cell division protein ZapA n=1 Tax=unclassified Enterococcus TaxID=2608891 RepID=UPI0024751D81|nr:MULTISPECIES: cell division protein ZapA [unclassified Enterococcus]MDH6364568.1 cell division protein ZapA [Enterococcus sp. PFB1-1]MDH6401669.1 cell division protein ZapA [Enterococcus sp. PF1-24]